MHRRVELAATGVDHLDGLARLPGARVLRRWPDDRLVPDRVPDRSGLAAAPCGR
jgi:hypothetical protein